jgi:hypothetical protein
MLVVLMISLPQNLLNHTFYGHNKCKHSFQKVKKRRRKRERERENKKKVKKKKAGLIVDN